MTIREQFTGDYKRMLDYFEKTYGEVEFCGTKKGGYFIYPKETKGTFDDLLTTMPAYSINALALFLQGVAQAERIREDMKWKTKQPQQ